MTYRSSFRLSLVLNLLFAGLFAFQFYSESNSTNQTVRLSPQVRTNQVANPRGPVVVRLNWRAVEHPEYPKYISNLREIGCPEETIQDLIIAEMNKLFANRYREQEAILGAPQPYWKPADPTAAASDLERAALRQSLEMERATLVRDLLGIDFRSEMAGYQMLDSNVPALSWMREFVPPEKIGVVYQIQTEFDEQRRLLRESNPVATAGAASLELELDRLHTLERTAVAEHLDAAELEQYELRFSPLAEELRYELIGFNPSESEFIELFRLKQLAQDQWVALQDGAGAQSPVTRSAVGQMFADEHRKILGDERFETFQRARDSEYRELLRFAQDNAWSDDTAGQVYHLKEVAQAEAARIVQNDQLDPEQRARALQVIRAETELTLAETLGETNWQNYRTQLGGWTRNLAPPPTEPPLPPTAPTALP